MRSSSSNMLLLLLLLSLYQFNSTPEPRMYPDHEGNCEGDVSPSLGQPNKRVHIRNIETPRTPRSRGGGRYECRSHASQNPPQIHIHTRVYFVHIYEYMHAEILRVLQVSYPDSWAHWHPRTPSVQCVCVCAYTHTYTYIHSHPL